MKSEQRKKLLQIGAAVCGGLWLLNVLVISPLSARWSEQSTRIAALREKVQRGQTLIDRQDAIRTHWAEMVRANLPGEISAAENEAFKAMARWARDSRISFSSLTPLWQTHEEGYKTFECRVAANGDQASLARFLYELESDPMPVTLVECEFTTRDPHGSLLAMTARFSFLRLEGVDGSPSATGGTRR
jgi:hypothetical protein